MLTGACLTIAKPGGHQESSYLVKLIAEAKITTIHFVPSMLQVFLEEQSLEGCASLKRVFCSGEALPMELQQRFHARLGCELHNLYGPTEAAIDVTFWQCQPESNWGVVPIGRPTANTQIYILDPQLQPVPIGVPGELYIGGVGVARGYLNRPELTAAKFIPNPFTHEPGDRLYKTGDRACYLADGNIQYLGRLDYQVKLRGFRIELGEIEAAVAQHPKVRQTVAIVREDQPGNKQLVAYVVPEAESLNTGELRNFLREKLPEYMVPHAFVLLPALPMLPNGKIDRNALPAPDFHSRTAESNFVPPRTPTQKMLADIWTQVLGLEVVGIHDNFFELGGDSIKAIQVIARLAQHNLTFKERQIFQYPTIAQLSRQVAQSYHLSEQGLVSGNVPLTPIQSWFFSTYSDNKHHFNQSLMLASPVRWNADALRRVCQKLLLHHDALRLRFQFVNGEVVQKYDGADRSLCFEIVDLIGRVDAISELETFANQVQGSMNLEHGPLIQFVLFHLDRGDRLLMAAHHLIVDTVSWRILLEDLSKGYEQACAGEEIQFPLKTDSYQQWSTALQKYSTTPVLVQQLEYWQQMGKIAVDELTVDVPDSENLVRDAGNLGFSLTPEETNSLLTEVHRPYNTEINDILLAALALALNAWCGGRRFLIDLEGHGRVDDIDGIDVSRTVGWFTSIYPVLLDLAPQAGLGYHLKSTKETLRRVPHKGIGYNIGRYLLPREEHSRSLLTQLQPAIMFNYLGRIDEDINSSVFEMASESYGDLISSESRRTHELEFSGIVYDRRLRISVTFSRKRFQPQTIQKLLDHYQQALQTILKHCLQQQTTEMTPSDLTYGNLSLEEFEEIFAEE
ncbi:hypothetical protein NUACC21_68980 [Scytonema sp. NUACC21]